MEKKYSLTHDHGRREPRIKRHNTFQVGNLFSRKIDIESFDVSKEMLDLATADDREDVGGL